MGTTGKAIRIVGRTLAGLVGLGGAAAIAGRVVLERRIAGEIDALLADARPAASATGTGADLEHLPEPVRRWLRYTGPSPYIRRRVTDVEQDRPARY